jgi:DNA gyrase subunit A
VGDIRIAGRNTQGVIVFKVSDGERVVSVTRLGELGDSAEGGPDGAGSNGVDEAPAGEGIGGEADGDAGAGETGPAIKE